MATNVASSLPMLANQSIAWNGWQMVGQPTPYCQPNANVGSVLEKRPFLRTFSQNCWGMVCKGLASQHHTVDLPTFGPTLEFWLFIVLPQEWLEIGQIANICLLSTGRYPLMLDIFSTAAHLTLSQISIILGLQYEMELPHNVRYSISISCSVTDF